MVNQKRSGSTEEVSNKADVTGGGVFFFALRVDESIAGISVVGQSK